MCELCVNEDGKTLKILTDCSNVVGATVQRCKGVVGTAPLARLDFCTCSLGSEPLGVRFNKSLGTPVSL